MNEMPIIELQVRRVAETITQAFVVHHEEIQAAIDEGVAQALRPANIQRLIDEECSKTTTAFVREKVRGHPRWRDSSLVATIKRRVTNWFTS